MQISFDMLIFLLFSDLISRGGAKVSEGGKLPQWGVPLPPCERKSVYYLKPFFKGATGCPKKVLPFDK